MAIEQHQAGRLGMAEEIYGHVLEAFPDHPDALHFHGVLLHQIGKSDEAIREMRRAAELQPEHADFQINLGNVLLSLGQLDEALQCFDRAIVLRPTSADAHCNRGVALRALRRDKEAAASYRAAILKAPEHASAYHNLANLLNDMSKHEEACEAYRKALSLREDLTESHQLLATTLWRMGRHDESIKTLRNWLRVVPDNPIAQHLLVACEGTTTPQRADDQYVRLVFDEFAKSFDVVLARLHYQAPQLVADLLEQNAEPPKRSLRVLDAGCGTGLTAPTLREYARELVGLDLSPRMLDLAKRTGLYDDLIEAELTDYLSGQTQRFDLIAVVDTFCYFGDLDDVLSASANALAPSGLLAFTVEKAMPDEAPDGVVLRFHGRFAHTRSYMEKHLALAGLQSMQIVEATLRRECGQPVDGFIIAARAAASRV